MSGLQINAVSTAQLIAMADGLLLDGDADFARDIYRVALRRSSLNDERQKIRTRLGLAAAPTSRTPMLMGVLQLIERNGFSDPFVSDGMATWLKTLPFSEDEKFQELAEKHAELLPIANWHWNLQTVLWAVQRNQNVPGDYVELGVFKGHTTLFCAEYVEFSQWPKRWLLPPNARIVADACRGAGRGGRAHAASAPQ